MAATHRANSQDWKFDWGAYDGGGSGLTYVGAGKGWYTAPKWSEQEHFSEEDGEKVAGIYVVQGEETGRIKIGYSVDVYRRLGELQCGCSERLNHLYTMRMGRDSEKILHDSLSEYRIHGEWFDRKALDKLESAEYPRV